ncbi:MAG: cytochrome C [Nitrospirota bacterium]|jgi:thiosulfate dehydrogenase
MLRKSICLLALGLLVSFLEPQAVRADEFTEADLKKWNEAFMTAVHEGDKLFHSALGTNAVSCDMCHPNGADTHPETYPKFQKQIGKVVGLRDMINWCIQNPLEGEPLAADDPKMYSIEAYIHYERRGVPMAPGKH